ncbi:hypothetical protein Fmac_020026 [Flemingia macrophylla]|uniref:C3H1-type domain-containing protein n=1 Tax=Flemingia macrophylla TaxID=520843 RepID=A0ABD1M9H8_9FABA
MGDGGPIARPMMGIDTYISAREEEEEEEAKAKKVMEGVERKLMAKTELCRRFQKGVCSHGSNCNYAHSLAELRRPQPKFCRLFLQHRHCPYGSNCRFLHFPNPQPEAGKLDRYFSAEYQRMQTSAPAPFDACPFAEHRLRQPSAASTATNASTSSLHNNEATPSYSVKRRFKDNELQKISRIYADWISDVPC